MGVGAAREIAFCCCCGRAPSAWAQAAPASSSAAHHMAKRLMAKRDCVATAGETCRSICMGAGNQ